MRRSPPGLKAILEAHNGIPRWTRLSSCIVGLAPPNYGDRTATVGPGAKIYIPQATRVMLRNTGTEPLAVAYVFSQPGYEEYLRDTSVQEGQSAPILSGPELAQIRERHKAHIVFDPQ